MPQQGGSRAESSVWPRRPGTARLRRSKRIRFRQSSDTRWSQPGATRRRCRRRVPRRTTSPSSCIRRWRTLRQRSRWEWIPSRAERARTGGWRSPPSCRRKPSAAEGSRPPRSPPQPRSRSSRAAHRWAESNRESAWCRSAARVEPVARAAGFRLRSTPAHTDTGCEAIPLWKRAGSASPPRSLRPSARDSWSKSRPHRPHPSLPSREWDQSMMGSIIRHRASTRPPKGRSSAVESTPSVWPDCRIGVSPYGLPGYPSRF